MKFFVTNILVIGLIVGGAFIHGKWTHRWKPFDREAVTASLDRVPQQIGEWVGSDAPEEDLSTYRDELDLGLIRRYTNRRTGMAVVMMLRGGPPGPIGKHHTPASCYNAVGFSNLGSDLVRSIEISPEHSGKWWISAFEKRNDGSTARVRVFWGYSGGNGWLAPSNPRVELASFEVCYKLYVIRNLLDSNDPTDGDLCEQFLREALPLIDSALFSQAATQN